MEPRKEIQGVEVRIKEEGHKETHSLIRSPKESAKTAMATKEWSEDEVQTEEIRRRQPGSAQTL